MGWLNRKSAATATHATAIGQTIELEGRGRIVLDQTDHVATGGEGSVFRKGDTAIKLYTDPTYMTKDGGAAKIQLLAAIQHPYIVAPKGLVLDRGQKPIGYWMPFAEGEQLPRLFSNDFRDRIGFADDATSRLVDRMRTAVEAAHAKGAVMVDGNELNYLALLGGRDGPEPRLIDVDSWAIGRYGARVVMPSIRDWHTKDFGRESDWFAWAIVTFQLYAGIHPYKGTAQGFARGDLEGRMRGNVSIFRNNVRVSRAVRDTATIPPALRGWYERTFENGERCVPPSPFDTKVHPKAAAVLRHVVTGGQGALIFEKLLDVPGDPVVRVFPCGVARLASGALMTLRTGRRITTNSAPDVEVVMHESGWLIGEAGLFRYITGDGSETPLPSPVEGKRILRCGERLFVAGAALTEVKLRLIGDRPFLTAGASWGILPNATHWFDGLGVQDAMGAAWLVMPFGEKACAQVRVPELDGVTPLAGLAGRSFAIVVGRDGTGTYKRIELTFDAEHRTYTATVTDTDQPEINAAMLARGICASVIDDGELHILVPATGATRIVQDRGITGDMRLSAFGETVVYVKDGAVWQVRMSGAGK